MATPSFKLAEMVLLLQSSHSPIFKYPIQIYCLRSYAEKETVDEVIFRTSKPRNRLMLELMARGGMRISEVLKLTPFRYY
jgi:hypothetical protein